MNSRVVTLADYRGTPRLRSAVEAFFSDKQLSANTRREPRDQTKAIPYQDLDELLCQILGGLVVEVGPDAV